MGQIHFVKPILNGFFSAKLLVQNDSLFLHVLLTLAPPRRYALNLKTLIKVSKVSWTSQLSYLDLHLKENLIRQTSFLPKKLLKKPASFRFIIEVTPKHFDFPSVQCWNLTSCPWNEFALHFWLIKKMGKGIFLAYHQSSKRELGRMSGKYLPWELVKYKVR